MRGDGGEGCIDGVAGVVGSCLCHDCGRCCGIALPAQRGIGQTGCYAVVEELCTCATVLLQPADQNRNIVADVLCCGSTGGDVALADAVRGKVIDGQCHGDGVALVQCLPPRAIEQRLCERGNAGETAFVVGFLFKQAYACCEFGSGRRALQQGDVDLGDLLFIGEDRARDERGQRSIDCRGAIACRHLVLQDLFLGGIVAAELEPGLGQIDLVVEQRALLCLRGVRADGIDVARAGDDGEECGQRIAGMLRAVGHGHGAILDCLLQGCRQPRGGIRSGRRQVERGCCHGCEQGLQTGCILRQVGQLAQQRVGQIHDESGVVADIGGIGCAANGGVDLGLGGGAVVDQHIRFSDQTRQRRTGGNPGFNPDIEHGGVHGGADVERAGRTGTVGVRGDLCLAGDGLCIGFAVAAQCAGVGQAEIHPVIEIG